MQELVGPSLTPGVCEKGGYLEVIWALFGEALGKLWGDFGTKKNRFRVRLYQSKLTKKWPNPLGSEVRLLPWRFWLDRH